jgi:hypothetical protein
MLERLGKLWLVSYKKGVLSRKLKVRRREKGKLSNEKIESRWQECEKAGTCMIRICTVGNFKLFSGKMLEMLCRNWVY